jgi:hypothetical protein
MGACITYLTCGVCSFDPTTLCDDEPGVDGCNCSCRFLICKSRIEKRHSDFTFNYMNKYDIKHRFSIYRDCTLNNGLMQIIDKESSVDYYLPKNMQNFDFIVYDVQKNMYILYWQNYEPSILVEFSAKRAGYYKWISHPCNYSDFEIRKFLKYESCCYDL